VVLDEVPVRDYLDGMKAGLSVTLSQELLDAIAALPADYRNRSVFLETAAWAFIAQLRRTEQSARDIEILNRRADFLNGELSEALTYQIPL
jgi:metal-responsive CopG/Arc/MetJ family transcriptional regulator